MDAAPISIDDLLGQATEAGASDLHLVPGAPLTMRVHGDLTLLQEEVMPNDVRSLLSLAHSLHRQQEQLAVNRQLDFSHGVLGLARFRVNVHFQRDSLAAASGTSRRSCGRSRSSGCRHRSVSSR